MSKKKQVIEQLVPTGAKAGESGSDDRRKLGCDVAQGFFMQVVVIIQPLLDRPFAAELLF